MSDEVYKGRCYCGATRLIAQRPPLTVAFCHCGAFAWYEIPKFSCITLAFAPSSFTSEELKLKGRAIPGLFFAR